MNHDMPCSLHIPLHYYFAMERYGFCQLWLLPNKSNDNDNLRMSVNIRKSKSVRIRDRYKAEAETTIEDYA